MGEIFYDHKNAPFPLCRTLFDTVIVLLRDFPFKIQIWEKKFLMICPNNLSKQTSSLRNYENDVVRCDGCIICWISPTQFKVPPYLPLYANKLLTEPIYSGQPHHHLKRGRYINLFAFIFVVIVFVVVVSVVVVSVVVAFVVVVFVDIGFVVAVLVFVFV